MTKASDCLFCKIIAGDTPADKVYEDEQVYAFHDINPQAPVHILVIPRKHIRSVSAADDGDEAVLGRLLLTGRQIASEQGLDDQGFRFVINTGKHGGQSVFHIHLHVLGGRQLDWPPG